MKHLKFTLLALITLWLTGCATDIQTVKDNADDYKDKEVSIKGTVTSSTNAVVLTYYTVKDASGEIRVTTDEKLPEKDTKVSVTGTVSSLWDMVIIKETKRSKALF